MRPVFILMCALLATSLLADEVTAQSLFETVEHYPVAADPRDVSSADFNDDGWPDLAVVCELGFVSVLFNQQDGTFLPATSLEVGISPRAVCAGQLDDDDYPEIITANTGSNSISVLFSRGDGSFDAAVHYPVGASPWDLAVMDFNGDLAADVAVVNREAQSIFLLWNDGQGTLTLAGALPAGGFYTKPSHLVAADIDADQDADLVVVKNYHNLYFNEGYIQIFINDGTGSFVSRGTTEIGPGANTPLAVDLDGDEDLDLAVSGFVDSSYKLSVLLNDGSGHFGAPLAYYAAGDGRACAADFDVDGDIDVLVAAQGVYASSFAVLLNHGDASFASPYTVSVGQHPNGMAAADFDRDGDPDVAVALWGDDEVATAMSNADPVTAISESDLTGRLHRLDQNTPNPFNPRTMIRYSLPQASSVELAVFDIQGRVVRVLETGLQGPGERQVLWNGKDDRGREVPSGIYTYRLTAGDFVQQRKMILVK